MHLFHHMAKFEAICRILKVFQKKKKSISLALPLKISKLKISFSRDFNNDIVLHFCRRKQVKKLRNYTSLFRILLNNVLKNAACNKLQILTI